MSHGKILLNAGAQFFGKVLTVVASFVIVKLVTSIGADFYGKYITTYEFLAFFGVLADAGLFAIAVRDISKNNLRIKDKELVVKNPTEFVLGNILSLRLILVVSVVVLAGLIAQLVPNYSSEVRTGIWITALSMGLTIIAGTLSSILQARMKIQKFSFAMVLGKLLLAGLIFYIVKNAELFGGAGNRLLFPLLWAGVVSNILFCGTVIFFVSREIRIHLLWHWEYIKNTLKVSLPYGMALILQTLYLRLDILLISIMLGEVAVGIYGVAARVLESTLVLGVFFGQAVLPKISAEESDHRKVADILSWGAEKLFLISLPLIIGVMAFAPDIVALLSSGEFLSTTTEWKSDMMMRILIPTVFFAFLNQLFTFTLVAKNRQNFLLIVNGTALGLNAILNFYLLPRYGITAAAFATVFCEVIAFILLTREVLKHFHLHFSLKNILILLVANGLMLIEIYLTPLGENFILAVAVCGITYIGVIGIYWKRFFLTKTFPQMEGLSMIE